MKTILIIFIICISLLISRAQNPASQSDLAKTFMRQGDYTNAILILKKEVQNSPDNINLSKDLALCYFFNQENYKALDVILPATGKAEADDQCFQITSNIYIALDKKKEAEKILRKGLKKFDASGALLSDLGELLWSQQNYEAIKLWEKGIESDPNFPGNYYNAARYYFMSADRTWTIIYGEIFVNMEPNSSRSTEIRTIMIEAFKKLFSATDQKTKGIKNNFEKAFLNSMYEQEAVAASGITTENLIMIRTRFLLKWEKEYASTFPLKLFDFHKQLLKDGIFDAYNQWLFESTHNPASYQNWLNLHASEYQSLDRIQKSIVFKMPSGQYYK